MRWLKLGLVMGRGRLVRSFLGRRFALVQRRLFFVLVLVLVAGFVSEVSPGVVVFEPVVAEAAVPPGAGEYVPVTPSRVVDTRSGLGGFTGTVGAHVSKSFTMTGVGGVPASGVSAVVVSVEAVSPTADSFLTVYPAGESRPTASQVSVTSGQSIANTVIAKLGTGGQISVYNNAGSTHVLIDVQGYFTDNTVTTAGGTFVPLSPVRIVNTMSGLGSMPRSVS